MPKHFFFDLDDTLTPSRSPMEDAHVPLFVELCNAFNVVVVSGSKQSQMEAQLPPLSDTVPYFQLTQNGNHAIDPRSDVLWSERFSDAQKELVFSFLKKIHDELALPVSDENDLLEDRGSQISYSTLGHHEKLEKKRAYDPTGEKRKALLLAHENDVRELERAGVEITVGGTTCLDIFLLGKHKGFNVDRLLQKMGWEKESCLYIGDALEAGRNDESVVGVIPTRPVANHEETSIFIKEMLS